MMDLTTLGEPLVAMVADTPGGWLGGTFRAHSVGAELNTATGLARLGHAAAFIGVLGCDEPGRLVERHLRAEGISAHVRRTSEAGTGMLIRDLRTFGRSDVTYRRAAAAGSTLGPDDVAAAADAIGASRWLHITGVTPALSPACAAAVVAAIAHARRNGVAVSLDVNHRAKLWSAAAASDALWPLTDGCSVVFGDDAELCVLTRRRTTHDAVAALLDRGVGHVVRKLGRDGAEAHGSGALVARAPGHAVQVVDPVGAGDAFAAGYLSALLDGGEPLEALRRGNVCGAYAISAVGDTTALPDRARLETTGASFGEAQR